MSVHASNPDDLVERVGAIVAKFDHVDTTVIELQHALADLQEFSRLPSSGWSSTSSGRSSRSTCHARVSTSRS